MLLAFIIMIGFRHLKTVYSDFLIFFDLYGLFAFRSLPLFSRECSRSCFKCNRINRIPDRIECSGSRSRSQILVRFCSLIVHRPTNKGKIISRGFCQAVIVNNDTLLYIFNSRSCISRKRAAISIKGYLEAICAILIQNGSRFPHFPRRFFIAYTISESPII